MVGTSMIIGDGILTPCISGTQIMYMKHCYSTSISALCAIFREWHREATSSLIDNTVMWISVAILFLLFQVQRFGTDKVGYSFAPILTIWFVFIGIIGFYDFLKYDPGVIKAINPMYIVRYFIRRKKDAWISLGGVVMCLTVVSHIMNEFKFQLSCCVTCYMSVWDLLFFSSDSTVILAVINEKTGSEALFANLRHFNVHSIQLSTCCLVFTSIVLAYVGQAFYLRKHNLDAGAAFYKSIPGPLYWPMFVVAVLASIITSQ
ncbi:hypothetical protein IFM89_006803 [Coptis chinensis]|uniref:K+ potassium transporter integral membrane domain-containing protein n=1 Tax=Coptis chinensis TaxID=261450 RepID=A0A835LYV0_9MAGN|nr:hypothetical protein IFM89_006803 [Coptis chinensis]